MKTIKFVFFILLSTGLFASIVIAKEAKSIESKSQASINLHNSVLTLTCLNHPAGCYGNISIGDSPYIPALIDTGSSYIRLALYCKYCAQILPGAKLQLLHKIKVIGGPFRMTYADSSSNADVFISSIKFENGLYINQKKMSLIKYGSSNILGVGYAAEKKHFNDPNSQPLFEKINKKYNFPAQFSILSCPAQGSGLLFKNQLPDKLLKITSTTLPVAKKNEFSVQHYGVTDSQGNNIISYPAGSLASFDSGYTADIYYAGL